MLKALLSFVIWCIAPLALAEGLGYEVLGAAPSVSRAPVEVIEFFSFGCPWCYKIEPKVQEWIKNQKTPIHFRKVPVVFHPEWMVYAKAYYLVDALSLTPQKSDAIFHAIMEDKKALDTPVRMKDFLIAEGIDKQVVSSAFESSPSIEMKIQESNQLMGQYHINAIPAFVVAQAYKTDLKIAGGEDQLFKLLTALVEKAQSSSH